MTDVHDVYEFEGDEVTGFTAQIPSTKLEVDGTWPRGTILNMNVSLRVRSVRIEEDRKGNITRHHILAVEEAQIRSSKTPAQRRAEFEAAEAALAAEQAEEEKGKVIAEEPGQEDVLVNEVTESAGISEEMVGVEHPADGTMSPEVENVAPEASTDDGQEWKDVDERDATARQQLQVENVEAVDTAPDSPAELDAQQYETVEF